MNQRPEDFDAQRRRILRQISLLTWGLLAAAVVLAIAGGALIAWFFTGAGYPFLRTWLIVSLILLVVPALVNVLVRLRAKGGGDEGPRAG